MTFMFINKSYKLFFSGFLFISLFLLMAQFSLPALALDNVINPWGTDDMKRNVRENVGLGEGDPRSMAASIISIALGFLGIIAVIIILFVGFKWMTSGGNEEQISGAKKMLTAGIIGLVIIVAAFAISNFILQALIKTTK
jgi:hypothetical protein